jgi:hypothetical protein
VGFFALMRDPRGSQFKVVDCHLNLWCLKGLFGPTLLFDMGLAISCADQAVALEEFQVALPFGTEEGGLQDLHESMKDQTTCELIFGAPVEVAGDTINYGWDPLPLLPLDLSKTHLEKASSNKEFSVWNIALSRGLQPGTKGYIRCRFEITSLGRTWIWKRWATATYGALVDFRFYDIREAWNVENRHALKERMQSIERLYLFIVAPASLQRRATNPEVHYTRILEGKPWTKYLGRAPSLRRSEKLTIYQWRSSSVIDAKKPFRVFMHLEKEFALLSFWNCCFILIVLTVISSVGRLFDPRTVTSDSARAISGFVRQHWPSVTVSAVFLGLLWLLKNQSWIRAFFQSVRRVLCNVDRWVMQKLA